MKKSLFIIPLFAFFISLQANAQEKRPADQKYEYFLLIQGVNSKADIAAIESNFRARPGVTYFESNKKTHKYFVLRSSVPISQASIEGWLNNPSYKLIQFADDVRSKE